MRHVEQACRKASSLGLPRARSLTIRFTNAEHAPATGSKWVRREQARLASSRRGDEKKTPRGGPRITDPLDLLPPRVRWTCSAATLGGTPPITRDKTALDVGP
jgi:hypothetical protein